MDDSPKQMTVADFIKTVLIDGIGQMVYDCKLHYLSFGVMAQGIEFLGACLDEVPFNKTERPQKRFRLAIKKLFGKRYEKYGKAGSKHYLYEGLRCGLTHMLKPQKRIFLTHRKESTQEGTIHLGEYNGKLVLVAEDLFDDFKGVCEDVIRRIDSGKITNAKVKETYIRVLNPAAKEEQEP